MADQIDPKQQHLDDHYGDVAWSLVEEPTGGAGMTPAQARSFLQRLRPVTRVKQTLGQLAKKAKTAA